MKTILIIIIAVVSIIVIGSAVSVGIFFYGVSNLGDGVGANDSGSEQDWKNILEQCRDVDSLGKFSTFNLRFTNLAEKTEQSLIDRGLTEWPEFTLPAFECMAEKRQTYLGR